MLMVPLTITETFIRILLYWSHTGGKEGAVFSQGHINSRLGDTGLETPTLRSLADDSQSCEPLLPFVSNGDHSTVLTLPVGSYQSLSDTSVKLFW